MWVNDPSVGTVSSFRIVTVPVPPAMTAPFAPLSTTEKVSSVSISVSPTIVTGIVAVV